MRKNKLFKRIASITLSAMIATTIIPTSFLTVSAASTNGFELGLNWNNYADTTNYVWNAENNDYREIALNVTYKNDGKATTDYEAGELAISVNGMGLGNNSSIAADDASSEVKTKQWSYTYNSADDIYIFTNNNKISTSSAVAGSFEIRWKRSAKDTPGDYTKEIQAVAAGKNTKVESNVVTYSQTRIKDEYTAKLSGSPSVCIDDTYSKDYAWVQYNSNISCIGRSLRLKSNYTTKTYINSAAKVYTVSNGTSTQVNASYISENTNVYKDLPNTYYVAYQCTPDETASQGYKEQEENVSIEVNGTYAGNDLEELIAQDSVKLNVSSYVDYTPTYSNETWNRTSTAITANNSHDEHTDGTTTSTHCNNSGWVNGTKVYSGESFAYKITNEFIAGNNKENINDLQGIGTVADFAYILQNNGNYRQLEETEYNFKDVTIPSYEQVSKYLGAEYQFNSGDITIEVYAKTKGAASFVLAGSKPVISKLANIITLPKDTTQIDIRILKTDKDSKTILYQSLPIKSTVELHLKDDSNIDESERVNTENGNLFFDSYNYYVDIKDNEYSTEKMGDCPYLATNFCYDESVIPFAMPNVNIKEKDIEIYGENGVTRQSSDNQNYSAKASYTHIHTLKNTINNYTNIDQPQKSSGDSFTSTINMTANMACNVESAPIKKFSIATILPQNTFILSGYDNDTTVYNAMKFSGRINNNYVNTADISKYTNITIIKNYRNSGRTYIKIDYDFTGTNFEIGTTDNNICASIPLYVTSAAQYAGMSFSSNSAIICYDTDYKVTSDRLSKDDGTYVSAAAVNRELFSDIDNNGDTNEPIMYDYYSQTISSSAIETYRQLTKYVKTEHTSGYVNDEAVVKANENYSYKISYSPGPNAVQNFEIIDMLEKSDGSEWQGIFNSVDTSNFFAYNKDGIRENAKIFYTTKDTPTDNDWTETMPEDKATIKGIKATVSANSIGELNNSYVNNNLYLIINMQAPTDTDKLNKISKNVCTAYFTDIDTITGDPIGNREMQANAATVKMTPKTGTAVLQKRDSTNNDVIIGAKFNLYSATDNSLIEENIESNSRGEVISQNVPYGNYYFKEVEAAKGYQLTDRTVPITIDGTKDIVKVGMTNDRILGTIQIQKVNDKNNNITISGAKFNLYSAKDDTLIKENIVTGENGIATINNVSWGSYYLIETEAPTGYNISNEKTEFTVNANNVSDIIPLKIENEQKPASTVLTLSEILEDGTTKTGEPLQGAIYNLYDSNNKLMGTYSTNSKGQISVSDMAFGNYTFIEKTAPEGYILDTESLNFTLTEENVDKPYDLQTYNARQKGSAVLFKSADDGEIVKGATYTLYLSDGTEQNSYVTDEEGKFTIENLYWNKYYLKETKAPQGYDLSNEEILFEINAQTVYATAILSTTDNKTKGSAELTKTNMSGNEVLQGAEYSLYTNSGTKVKDKLISDENGKIKVTDLSWGTYYFLETKAPTGYGLSNEKIKFSVNYLTAQGTQQLSAKDPDIQKVITISKTININDLIYAHGTPTFFFDIKGTNNTYTQEIVFDENSVNEYKQSNPTSDTVTLSTNVVVEKSDKYIVSEKDVMRYEYESITDIENGTINDDKTATIDLTTNDTGSVTFKNSKSINSRTSDNGQVEGVFTAEKKYIALNAQCNIDVQDGETFDRNNLVVTALYDNDSTKILSSDEYTLSQETFDPNMSGEYTINVTYTEGGNTCTTSFNLNVQIGSLFTYHPQVDGTVAIDGYLGTSEIVKFPSKINGLKVSAIEALTADKPISGIENVKTVVFSEGIRKIGNYAFYNCCNIEGNITLPDSMLWVGDYAFVGVSYSDVSTSSYGYSYNNPETTFKLYLGNKLKHIGKHAFEQNAFRGDLHFPETLEYIGDYAFSACYSSSQLHIGDLELPNCSYIGNSALAGLLNGSYSYDDLPVNNIHIGGKSLYIGQYAFSYVKIKGNITIDGENAVIDSYAFNYLNDYVYQNRKLTAENVTDMTDIYISNFSQICSYAFSNISCKSLYITGNGTDSTIESSSFCYANSSDLMNNIYYGGNLSDEERETIGVAFYSQQKYVISGVKVIGEYAFYNNGAMLGKVTINGINTEIKRSAFYECGYYLSQSYYKTSSAAKNHTLTLNGTYNSIGEQAFYECHFVGKIEIPNIETLNDYTFEYCNFDEIIISNATKSIGQYCFMEQNWLYDALKDYKETQGYDTTLTIPKSVKNIGSGAFRCCSIGGTLNFENSAFDVLAEGTGQFYNTSFSQVNLSSGMKTIPNSCFGRCENLMEVNNADNVTTYGSYAFSDCTKLETINSLNSNSSIENRPFIGTPFEKKFLSSDGFTVWNNTLISYTGTDTNVVIPSNITKLSTKAFSNCEVQSVTLNSNIEKIPSSAFSSCTALKEIKSIESITQIDNEAFYGCTALTSINLPNATQLGSYVFSDCTALTSIDLPNVIQLGSFVFSNCTALTSVKLPKVKTIDEYIFGWNGKDNIQIDIGNDIENISDNAFYKIKNSTINLDKKQDDVTGSPWGADSSITINWIG